MLSLIAHLRVREAVSQWKHIKTSWRLVECDSQSRAGCNLANWFSTGFLQVYLIKYIFITFDLYNLNTFSLFNLWNKSIQTEKEKNKWKKIRRIPLFILSDFELSFFSMAAFLCVCLSVFSFCYGSYSRVIEEHYQASSNNLNLKNTCIFLRYFMCNNFQTLHYFCKELHLRSHSVPPNGL